MGTTYGKAIGIGGIVSRYVDNEYVYVVHYFANNDIFTLTQDIDIDYLLVGGGGGTSAIRSSGGGGGGVLQGNAQSLSKGAYPVTVGRGGTKNPTNINYGAGINGGNSSFGDLIAYGGGGGVYYTGQPGSGGSGGGLAHTCCGLIRGAGIAGQGNDGGLGIWGRAAGGGGGAGQIGGDATQDKAGDGGDGVLSSITGESKYYGGGGAGGLQGYVTGILPGVGGLGGGGNSGGPGSNSLTAWVADNNNSGVDGLGGGAGGSGGDGGDGVVIVRYKILKPQY